MLGKSKLGIKESLLYEMRKQKGILTITILLFDVYTKDSNEIDFGIKLTGKQDTCKIKIVLCEKNLYDKMCAL